MKFVSDNNLYEAVERGLIKSGCKDIWISVEPIREAQKIMEQTLTTKGILSEEGKQVILSGHNNEKC
jgi:hypothetical protein